MYFSFYTINLNLVNASLCRLINPHKVHCFYKLIVQFTTSQHEFFALNMIYTYQRHLSTSDNLTPCRLGHPREITFIDSTHNIEIPILKCGKDGSRRAKLIHRVRTLCSIIKAFGVYSRQIQRNARK